MWLTHPGADRLAGLHGADRLGIAADERDPEVGAEGLGAGPDDHPPGRATACDDAVRQGAPATGPGVVILDDEHLRAPGQDVGQLGRPGRGQRRPRRVLGPRRAGSPPAPRGRVRRPGRAGSHPVVVDGTGSATRPRAAIRSSTPGVARVLDRDPHAGPEVRLERPFDGVERPARHGDGPSVRSRRLRTMLGPRRSARPWTVPPARRTAAGRPPGRASSSGRRAGSGLPDARSRVPGGGRRTGRHGDAPGGRG